MPKILKPGEESVTTVNYMEAEVGASRAKKGGASVSPRVKKLLEQEAEKRDRSVSWLAGKILTAWADLPPEHRHLLLGE